MKLKTSREELFKLISKTQNVVEKRNTMPVLSNVLIEASESKLLVFATDLEVSLKAECSIDLIEEGKAVINARSLFDILRELPEGDLTLTKKSNQSLEIEQGKAIFHINGMNPDEFPVFPTYSTSDFSPIIPSVFKEMIEKTIYSVSNDETRYHLNGVFFEGSEDKSTPSLRMVATDGHRMSLVDRKVSQVFPQNFNQGVIIPKKGLHEIKKIIDTITEPNENVDIAVEGAQLIVKTNDSTLMIRLIEGKYPNYQQLIPQKLKSHAVVNKDNLLASLKRVSLLSNQKSKGVTFSFNTDGKMEIFSNSPDLGDAKEELDVDYSGENLKIGFNARYILDVLASINEKDVKLSFIDQLSPGLLGPKEDDKYRCVVMPMRI